MNFGNLKRWELIALCAAAAAAAVVLRILEENGVLSVPRIPAIIFVMVFVAVFFLRRPAAILVEYFKTHNLDKDKRSTLMIDVVFAIVAEGVPAWLLLSV